jgi:mono/diheme cytochrome c family protein
MGVAVWMGAVANVVGDGAVLQQPEPAATAPASAADSRALLDRYCVSCHNERANTGGLALDTTTLDDPSGSRGVWEKVVRKLRLGAMPPAGMPRPDGHTYDALASFLESRLDATLAAQPNPGRPAIHRLNRTEYQNAIRDLLALDVDAAMLLPPDDSSGGFDNNAEALGLSPALLQSYLSAAARISADAVTAAPPRASSATYRVRGDASQTQHIEGLPLGTRGGLAADHLFPADGAYVIRVNLLQTNLGSVRGLEYPHDMEFSVDGTRVHLARVGGDDDYTAAPINATDVVESLNDRLQARVLVKTGPRRVVATFLEKTSAQMGNRLQAFERSTLIATDHLGVPHVESMTISGPFDASGTSATPSRERIFVCRPDAEVSEQACATRIISTLARRAYRRPVTGTDLAPLVRFYQTGRDQGGFEAGIELALRAVLASPGFVFRSERDPAGAAPGTVYAVRDVELASRLSFFLWSSIPDDELLQVAEAGTLRHPAVLERQVRRLLADNRAEQALVTNFAGQWLQLRNIRATEPDKNLYPDFDDNLRRAFLRELELFVGSVVREDRSVLDLLSAGDTYLDERLARHYGIPGIYGSRFRRVALADDARRGLLGKGGILLLTSHADRTSPVVRGKWMLENLLGSPPPPPPPNVPLLNDDGKAGVLTMRERMEAHRANPVCASCHKIMDPLGLSLEHFDAVGRWRSTDAGHPIDASGVLVDGASINGVAELREALLARSDVFVTTMTEKLLAYALGRQLEPYDLPAVRAIVRHGAADDYRLSALVLGVVESAPFRQRIVSAPGEPRAGVSP